MNRIRLSLFISAALLLFAARDVSAQRRVAGRVTGGAGEPIPSASVNVQGTAINAYTGDDGRFVLVNVPASARVLVVRRIGYKRVNQPFTASQDVVDVKLERDALELERQVVTGTTTTVSSVNSANAVASVSGDQLNRAPTPTIENALQGKIPGAVISTNSGAPGGGSQVQLRGITSINASSSPLYVIDGVLASNSQISSGLNAVTAAGGGMMMSTQDQPTNRISDLNPADIESIEVLKGASAGAIYGSKASNGVIIITTRHGNTGQPSASITQRVGQFSLSHKLGLRCFTSADEVTNAGYDATDWTANGGGCNDFEQQFYGNNPLSYETNLALRGGSGGTTYYVGGLAKRDAAIQRNSYYQKQSVTANVGQLIGSRLTLRSNNEFIHSLTDRGISGNDNNDIVSPGDVFASTPTWIPLNSGLRNPYLPSGSNPFQTADLVKIPEDVYRYIGSVNSTFTFLSTQRQTFDVTFLGGVDAYSFNSHLTSPPNVFFEANDGLAGTNATNKTQNINANLNLSGAHKLITDALTATTSFGLRQERRQSDAVTNLGRRLPEGVTNVNYGVVQSVNENQFLVKDFAYYAQEEFLTLNERLLLTGAINSERSSVNGDDKKWYSYPKAALSYRMPLLPRFTDEIKLRVAYGRAGNQPPYGYKFTTLPIGVLDGQLGARTSAIAGAANIKPEVSTELEGGVDMQFGGGRVALDATVFRKTVDDLILAANVASTSGISSKFINGGAIQNTGTEIGLNVTPIQRNNFNWVSRTTFANVDGRITRLDVPCFNGGSFFGTAYGSPYVCQGYSPSAVQARNGFDTTFSSTGAFVSRARHISVYESAPDFTMGFSNEFNIGQVRLYGLLDWRRGGKVANLTDAYFDGATADGLGFLADTAKSAARIRSIGAGGSYLEDGGFLKLREISVSYTLPSSVTKSLFSGLTQGVRLEVSARNLKTWTSYSGYDPEVSNFSNQNIGRFQDVTPYPPSRSLFFSLSANY
ncbi:MAG: SusC/RagA family TonB-linked outer membrane protein [bacterium]